MDVASSKWLSEVLQGVEDYNNTYEHQQLETSSLNQLAEFGSDDQILVGGDNYKQDFSSESNSSYSTITTSGGSDSIKKYSHHDHHQPLKYKLSSSNSSHQLLSFDNYQNQYYPNSSSPPKINMSDINSTTLRPKKELSQTDIDFSSLDDHDHVISNNKDHSFIISNKKENYSSSSQPSTFIKGTNDYNNNNKRPYSMIKTPSHAQEHIMAERKRREKLTQRFIALSAIVPGLKKMDKASVLGDTIVYVKQLQERVNILEEQTKSRTVESVVFKKSQVSISSSTDEQNQDSSSSDQNQDSSSSNNNNDNNNNQTLTLLPEIEARVYEKDVLIRIHCENHKGIVVKILSEIEKLDHHLSVVNTSVMPFGNCTLDITILAQMEKEFSMTVKDLVKNLRKALLKIM